MWSSYLFDANILKELMALAGGKLISCLEGFFFFILLVTEEGHPHGLATHEMTYYIKAYTVIILTVVV